MELQIHGVSQTYANGVQALKDVTLTIPAGMYGLLGPNGAGKSTLMRMIATLQEPDTGTITLGGIDVVRQKDEVRKTLGYLPQELLEAEPLSAVEELQGRIWRRVISTEALPELEREHAVISTKLYAGRTVAHVYCDSTPGPGFELAKPDLEDVYFSAIAGRIGRRREHQESEGRS